MTTPPRHQSFTVPGIPGQKARHRTTKSGHTYTPAKTVEYETRVAIMAHESGIEIMQPPIAMSVTAYWPSKKPDRKHNPRKEELKITIPDIDNVAKAVMDGLGGIAYAKDSVVAILIGKKYHAAQGEPARTVVELEGEVEG